MHREMLFPGERIQKFFFEEGQNSSLRVHTIQRKFWLRLCAWVSLGRRKRKSLEQRRNGVKVDRAKGGAFPVNERPMFCLNFIYVASPNSAN